MNPHIDKNDFLFDYAILGAQRNLKILGVFARLSIKFSKDRYLDYIPRVWGYIIGNLKHPVLSDLQSWLLEVMPDDMKEYK